MQPPPRGRTRRWLDQLLHTHDTPQRTAAAFALGVFFGFSPFLGLHTVLGLAVAFALNLNRVAMLLGIYSNLPWILPAYYTVATVAGAAMLGAEIPDGLLRDFTTAVADVSWTDFKLLAGSLAPLAWAYMLGSTLGALILATIAYRVALTAILAHRSRVASMKQVK
jgi:uncharacterized protein (DUF2062 family)